MSASYHSASGPQYLLRGLSLIWQPELRLFVLIPLLINLLLFSGAFYVLCLQLGGVFAWLEGHTPDYLHWLGYLLWPLAVVSIVVVFSLLFTSVANLLAAPFNGLLAE